MFENFSDNAVEVLMLSQESARKRKVEMVCVGDLLVGLLKIKKEVYNFLSEYKVTIAVVNSRLIKGTSKEEEFVKLPFSEEAHKALKEAINFTFERKVEEVDLMYALCNTSWCLDLLESAGLNVKGVETHFEQVIYKKNNPHLNISPFNQSPSSNKIESKELSRRDYFAGHAMGNLISSNYTGKSIETIVEAAVNLTDALIKELDKEKLND